MLAIQNHVFLFELRETYMKNRGGKVQIQRLDFNKIIKLKNENLFVKLKTIQ